METRWDVFISHSSEDKPFVRQLAAELEKQGLKVWFDEATLKLGDSLRRSISEGLAESRYAIVVLSPAFFARAWTQYELDGLVTREIESGKVILPIWHQVNRKAVAQYSLALADKMAISTSEGLPTVVQKIMEVVKPGAQVASVSPESSRSAFGKPTISGPVDRNMLRQTLMGYFSDSELRDLCFDLGLDYESLPGEGKASKARELIAYLERRSNLPRLVEAVRQLRPNAPV